MCVSVLLTPSTLLSRSPTWSPIGSTRWTASRAPRRTSRSGPTPATISRLPSRSATDRSRSHEPERTKAAPKGGLHTVRLSGHGDRFDDDGVLGTVAAIGRRGGDGVDDLLARRVGDLTEDRVLPVEVRRRTTGDEEL